MGPGVRRKVTVDVNLVVPASEFRHRELEGDVSTVLKKGYQRLHPPRTGNGCKINRGLWSQ